jgi:tetratricopeptide (TPR) repeat protein
VFELPTDQSLLAQQSFRILVEGKYQQYVQWKQTERDRRLLEIREVLEQCGVSNTQAHLLLEEGNLFVASQDYKSAITSYDQAVAHKPDFHEAWYNRGNALFKLGRIEEAIASYDKAVESSPDKHEAWDNRGYALYRLGRTDEAILSHDRALSIQPDLANALYNKACVYGLQGQIEKATSSLKRAISVDPDYLEMAKTDTDLDAIRGDALFQAMMETLAEENRP